MSLLSSASATDEQNDENALRLGLYSPMKTVGMLLIGPIISQIGTTVAKILETYWIGKFVGSNGMSVIGASFVPQYIIHGFSLCVYTSVTVKISYLHGKKSGGLIPDVVFDILRFTAILSVLLCALMLLITNPLLKWTGVKDSNVRESFEYIMPLSCGFVVTAVNQMFCALLQANGMSVHYGLARISDKIIHVGIILPLFFVMFKSHVWCVSLSIVISELITSVAIGFYLVKKELLVLPTDRRLLRAFTKQSISAIKVGTSSLVMIVAMVIPSGVVQRYLSNSSRAIGAYTEVMSVWHMMARVYNIVNSIINALTSACIPAASYAYGAGLITRMYQIMQIHFGFGTLWAAFSSFLYSFYPAQTCSMWITDDKVKKWVLLLIPPSTYTAALSVMRSSVIVLLQSMKLGIRTCFLGAVSQLAMLPLFASIFYHLYPTSPEMIVWCYVCTDVSSYVISILFAVGPVKKSLKKK